MEELYVEGVATQGAPESCVVVCEGGGEALTWARAGEPRNVGGGRCPRCTRPTAASSCDSVNAGGVTGLPLILRRDMTGQRRQQFGRDCAEHTFDLAPAGGLSGVSSVSWTPRSGREFVD